MKRFWISWYQKTEDPRPIHFPPSQGILGWWSSGVRNSDDAHTISCVVDAKNEKEAMLEISKDWPEEEREHRFCKERENDFQPGDRFPLSEWMRDRFKKKIK